MYDKVFLARANVEDGVLNTNGIRMLSVLGIGGSLEEARENAYMNIDEVKGIYFTIWNKYRCSS